MFCKVDYISDCTDRCDRLEHHAPTLIRLKAKGKKCYVFVSLPEALRKGSQKQVMR
jgi:hypothetical protein